VYTGAIPPATPHPFVAAAPPLVIAHRGASEDAPENTLPAFEAAVEAGCRYLETDAHVSRDGVVVAFHDHRLDGKTDRRGDIEELTIAEIESGMRAITSPGQLARSPSGVVAYGCHDSRRSLRGGRTSS